MRVFSKSNMLCLFFILSPGFKHPVWKEFRISSRGTKEQRRNTTLGFRRADFDLFKNGIRFWKEEGPREAG